MQTPVGTPSHQPSTQSSWEHPASGARRVKLPSAHDQISQCHLQLGRQPCFDAVAWVTGRTYGVQKLLLKDPCRSLM